MIFEDNLDLAVFCTESILKQKMGIDVVFHDRDGDFCFLNRHEENRRICLLSLEEVVNIDSSITQVLNIPLGYAAWRESSSSKWIIEPFEDEEDTIMK